MAEACLAFALTVAHYHNMRKSMVPVPYSEVMSFVRQLAPEDTMAAEYAFSLPDDFGGGKVEIWAEDYCEEKGLK